MDQTLIRKVSVGTINVNLTTIYPDVGILGRENPPYFLRGLPSDSKRPSRFPALEAFIHNAPQCAMIVLLLRSTCTNPASQMSASSVFNGSG